MCVGFQCKCNIIGITFSLQRFHMDWCIYDSFPLKHIYFFVVFSIKLVKQMTFVVLLHGQFPNYALLYGNSIFFYNWNSTHSICPCTFFCFLTPQCKCKLQQLFCDLVPFMQYKHHMHSWIHQLLLGHIFKLLAHDEHQNFVLFLVCTLLSRCLIFNFQNNLALLSPLLPSYICKGVHH